jgi:DnaJ-class molecular chaperone with C-terminal Zn finger domain
VKGRIIASPCDDCGGVGTVRREKTLEVTIPAGIEDGTRIRLSGEGEAGARGAPPGDLYIFISIAPHPLFLRNEADILCTVPIPMTTAALGGSVELPSIDGTRAKVPIPAGAQSGHRLRLRGKGMSGLQGKGRGDMYIDLKVETPVTLTKEQKEKLNELQAMLKFQDEDSRKSTSPESEGFFKKAKELWDDLTDLANDSGVSKL